MNTKILMDMVYFVYILTNKNKNVLYTGITNDIYRRIDEHFSGEIKGISQKYNCKYLIYYEKYLSNIEAIMREKIFFIFYHISASDLIYLIVLEYKFKIHLIMDDFLAVVSYPKIKASDYKWINEYRKENDYTYDLIDLHWSFVFPVFDYDDKEFIGEVKLQAKEFKTIDFQVMCNKKQ
jgi:predicted GIY-YIG superfamily endonuclease